MKRLLTKDNREIVIRKAVANDTESSIRFSKQIFGLPTVLSTVGEFNRTLESQTAWINSLIESEAKLILVAMHENEVIGLLDFSNHSRSRLRHTGEFGVSVLPEFENNGIARTLIQILLEWAKENQAIEKVNLKVSSNNPKAFKLYESLGFKTEGRMVNEIKLEDGTYVDTILMGQLV